jgi:DNA-binding MarR family transcriptional regulator
MVVPNAQVLAAALQRFGLERDRMRAALASATGIGATELDALEHLEADGPLTQRQLGERLSLTSGAITMLVDRLEEAGWVSRSRHPTDRRSVLVELTPRATESIPAALDTYHSRIKALAGAVPAGHRDALRSFLQAAGDGASAAAAELRG